VNPIIPPAHRLAGRPWRPLATVSYSVTVKDMISKSSPIVGG